MNSLREVLKSDNPQVVASGLKRWELPGRTKTRFEYTIEAEIYEADKVEFWKKVKEAYDDQ